MSKKEKWLTDVENSINGIQLVEVNPYLYSKILNRLQTDSANYISKQYVVVSSLAFVVLILLNVFIFKSVEKNKEGQNTDLIKVSTTFNLSNENYINYN